MQPETLGLYDDVDLEIPQATCDAVFQELTELGAVSLHRYLQGDTDVYSGMPSTTNLPSYPSTTPSINYPRHDAVSRLNATCQRVFGNTDPLRYEFVEENGPKSKQCILTIVRNDGTQRSYTTQPIFSKKAEAKAEVSKIAIEIGALEFLMFGETKERKGPRNSPASSASDGLSAGASSSAQVQPAEKSSVDVIESCCIEWRAERVSPRWIALTEPKLGLKHGCALLIKLSSHLDRVYMSEPTFDTYDEARDACAKAAISEGVLHFIKHGDGRVRPLSPRQSPSPLLDVKNKHSGHCKLPLTLQNFFDTLPRPFPEALDTNDAYKINAPTWLSSLIQNSKGGKLAMTFNFISGTTPGLHGCLLRIDRPGTYKAYLVDAEFSKRADAKAAVCLQAMSRGIGEYIRSIVSSVESKLTSQMRSFSHNYIYPTLQSELSKIESGLYPHFEFDKERDAVGATLFVRLSGSSTPEQSRKYVAPCEYRSKSDAKAAVIALAAEQGVIEFVRFRGRPPPPGYSSPYILQNYDGDSSRKRSEPDSREEGNSRPSKKQKKNVPRGSDKDPLGTPSQDDGSSDKQQHYGDPRPDGASGTQESRADWQIPMGSGNVYDLGIDYPRSFGLPFHGVTTSCDYGQLPFTGPLPFSMPVDPCSYVLGGTNGLPGTGAFNSIHPPVTHSLSPLFPIIAQHSIPLGCSNAPKPLFVDTAAMPLTFTRSRDSILEPGEVRSPTSSRYSQDPGSCIQTSEQVRGSGGTTSTKTVDPRKKAIPRPAPTAEAPTVLAGLTGESKRTELSQTSTSTPTVSEGQINNTGSGANTSHVAALIEYCVRNGAGAPSFHDERGEDKMFKVWIVVGKERFELRRTYHTAEGGRQCVARKVLARLRSQQSNGGGAEGL
ncbi:hypothetical protein EDD15DRAFT_2227665 [Pisolithus albus]|nr:hypothetical protein EDD15DRAFT_2227665 [Pisolithus albus]